MVRGGSWATTKAFQVVYGIGASIRPGFEMIQSTLTCVVRLLGEKSHWPEAWTRMAVVLGMVLAVRLLLKLFLE